MKVNYIFDVSNISRYGLIDKDQKYLSDELYQKIEKRLLSQDQGKFCLLKIATPGIAYMLKESVEGIIAGRDYQVKT